MEKYTVCLNHFLGLYDCSNCTTDLDPNKHPNNTDCPRYKPIGLLVVNVVDAPVEPSEIERIAEVQPPNIHCDN